MSKDFNELLESAFPKWTWPAIIRAQLEGIALADDVRKNTPLFNNLLGRDLQGHIRRIGVLHRLNQYCQTGDLPFIAEVGAMPHGTWHWLNLRSGSFVAHVARTDSFGEIPEETKNRQSYLLKNTGDLFDDGKIVPITELISIVDRFYAYITFAAFSNGKLAHSALGMAASDNKTWLGLHDLLSGAGSDLSSKPEPAPKVDPKQRIKFTEEVEQLLSPDKDKQKK